jgi:RNA polymerase sigma factor (sigma-70 family)
MSDDSHTGASGDQFPVTRRSAVIAAGSSDRAERQRALEILVAAYWKPVYKYIRIKWNKSDEDAQDLTQGFFAKAIEKDFFQGYDPAKARFRTFLRTCLDAFASNEDKAARRIKRGGNAEILSLDFESAEGELKHLEIPSSETLDDTFEKEWVRSLFGLAVESLRIECESKGKGRHFQLFERYHLDNTGPTPKLTYQQLAVEFEISVSHVTNILASMRHQFRRLLLKKLHDITATDAEYHREARALLGVDPDEMAF